VSYVRQRGKMDKRRRKKKEGKDRNNN